MHAKWLHSELDAFEARGIAPLICAAVDSMRPGRRGDLLREGLDLPEVSLVAILDADKEGFLRAARPR